MLHHGGQKYNRTLLYFDPRWWWIRWIYFRFEISWILYIYYRIQNQEVLEESSAEVLEEEKTNYQYSAPAYLCAWVDSKTENTRLSYLHTIRALHAHVQKMRPHQTPNLLGHSDLRTTQLYLHANDEIGSSSYILDDWVWPASSASRPSPLQLHRGQSHPMIRTIRALNMKCEMQDTRSVLRT